MTVIVSSAFTAANGTELDAYIPEINLHTSAWVLAAMDSTDGAPAANDVEIQGNKLRIVTSTKGAYLDTKLTDYTYTTDIVVGADKSGFRFGLSFRWTDKDNNYYWNVRPANNDWTLYKRAGGAQTTAITTTAYTFNTSTTYTLQIVVSGTSVTLKINGSTVGGPYTMDAHTTATKIGLHSRSITGNIEFDNLTIDGTPILSLDAADYYHGETIGITKTTGNWSGTPTATLNGVAISLTGISGAVASAVIPAESLFAAGQSHVNTPHNTDLVFAVTDSAGTYSRYLQIIPVDDVTTGSSSGIRAGTQYFPVTGAVDGDYQHIYKVSGSIESNAEAAYFRALTVPSVARIMAFRAGAWLAHREVTIDNDVDGWPFRDLFTDTNGVLASAHTPDATIFPAGWSAVERDSYDAPAASTLVSINGNALRVNGANRGVSIDTQQVTKVMQAMWAVQSANDGAPIHVARVDDATWVGVYADANANRITMYQVAGGASAGSGVTSSPVTLDAGNTYAIRIELVEPSPPSLLHTLVVQVDGVQVLSTPVLAALPSTATRIGLYSGPVYPIDYAAVYVDCEDLSAFSITLAASEVAVGGAIGVTKIGGNFSGTVTATWAGVAATISGVSGDDATLTIPGLAEFLAGGDHVLTPLYVNQPVTVTDNDGTFEATLMATAPVPEGYAEAGPGPYANDIGDVQYPSPVYLRVISGSASLDPEDVNAVGEGTIGGRFFDLGQGGWSAETQFAATPAVSGTLAESDNTTGRGRGQFRGR